MHKWMFETGSGRNTTHYDVTLDRDDSDLPVLISDTRWPEENTIRLYDVDGIKKLRLILTEIENYMGGKS